MDCKECKSRFRADQLIEEATNHEVNCSKMTNEEMEDYMIAVHEIVCPNVGAKNFTGIRQFNLMFKTFQGVLGRCYEHDLSASGNSAGYLCKF